MDEHNIPDITHISFLIGAILSISTILWSVLRVRELPLSEEEQAKIAAAPKSVGATLGEIWSAIREMPQAMRQMAWMSLFQWYGLSIYWSYGVLSISRSIYNTSDKTSDAFRDAALTSGQLGALYNMLGFGAAFLMVPLARRYGPKLMHMACLALAGLTLLYLPFITGGVSAKGAIASLFGLLAMPNLAEHLGLIIPAIGMGLGWASIMGNPYVILAGSIPPERTGVYMGIFNMMIVIPMLINGVTFGWLYRHVLGNDPRNAIMLAGGLLICAAITMIWVKDGREAKSVQPEWITLHGRQTSVILECQTNAAPLWRYWGPRLPDWVTPGAGLLSTRETPSFSLDQTVPFSVFPRLWHGLVRAIRAAGSP